MTRSQQQRVPHRAWRPVRNDKIVGVYAALWRRSSTVARASVTEFLRGVPQGLKPAFFLTPNGTTKVVPFPISNSDRGAGALSDPKALDGATGVVPFPSIFLRMTRSQQQRVPHRAWRPVRNDKIVGVYAALKWRSSTVAPAAVHRSSQRPSGAEARIENHSYRSAEALRHPKALDGATGVVPFPSGFFLTGCEVRKRVPHRAWRPVRNDGVVGWGVVWLSWSELRIRIPRGRGAWNPIFGKGRQRWATLGWWCCPGTRVP